MTIHEQIKHVDEALGLVREIWMDAAEETSRAKCMGKINHILDRRLELMKERDLQPA